MLPVPEREGLFNRVNRRLGFAPKDWFTTIFSLLALGISSVTAYYTVVRTTDNLSLVIGQLPDLEVKPNGILELSHNEIQIILMNSGSRDVALSTFLVSVSQLRPDMRRIGSECLDEILQQDRTQTYKTDLDGLVVRSKEVRVQRFRLSRDDPQRFPLAPFNKNATTFRVALCFNIDAVAPSSADIEFYQIVREWEVSKSNDGTYNVFPLNMSDGRKPISIYQRTGTIFGD